jgi:hypothetical protein
MLRKAADKVERREGGTNAPLLVDRDTRRVELQAPTDDREPIADGSTIN